MKKIKLDIVSGFLGAGKTTFIMKLMKDLYKEESVVILENEFGKINIDKETLQREKLSVKPVQAGCICCSGSTDLLKGMEEIISEFHPERIIVEPTGIARLCDVKRLILDSSLMDRCEMDHIITIVDAKNYYKRIAISKEFFENQIIHSDVIFLSKTEELETEKLINAVEAIHKIQPRCHVISKDWGEIDGGELKKLIGLKQVEEKKQGIKLFKKYINDFTSFEVEKDTTVSLDTMKEFVLHLEDRKFGEIYRIKGICLDRKEGWYSVEGVPGETKFLNLNKETEENEKSRICIIGRELNKELLKQFFM